MSNVALNAAADLPRIVAFCADYASLSLGYARLFLIAAILAAAVETALALWSKLVAARAAPQGDPSRSANPDSIAKLLEALKGLLESLTKLPTWVAIFLAGLALLWMSGQRPEICAPQPRAQAPGPAASGQPPPTQAPGRPGEQAPAGRG